MFSWHVENVDLHRSVYIQLTDKSMIIQPKNPLASRTKSTMTQYQHMYQSWCRDLNIAPANTCKKSPQQRKVFWRGCLLSHTSRTEGRCWSELRLFLASFGLICQERLTPVSYLEGLELHCCQSQKSCRTTFQISSCQPKESDPVDCECQVIYLIFQTWFESKNWATIVMTEPRSFFLLRWGLFAREAPAPSNGLFFLCFRILGWSSLHILGNLCLKLLKYNMKTSIDRCLWILTLVDYCLLRLQHLWELHLQALDNLEVFLKNHCCGYVLR